MKVSNVRVYGLEDSIKASKYPMATQLDVITSDVTPRVKALAQVPTGTGHDNFLNGIIVQFDLTFSNKAWVELQRYHFIDFVSSQSTMHRITKFDLDRAYNKYVDSRVVDIMKDKVAIYNKQLENINKLELAMKDQQGIMSDKDYRQSKDVVAKGRELLKEMYLEILYTNPAGFELTAKMTTNYRQLKTIYQQRKDHRLPEWREFCKWVETLPHSEFIVGDKKC